MSAVPRLRGPDLGEKEAEGQRQPRTQPPGSQETSGLPRGHRRSRTTQEKGLLQPGRVGFWLPGGRALLHRGLRPARRPLCWPGSPAGVRGWGVQGGAPWCCLRPATPHLRPQPRSGQPSPRASSYTFCWQPAAPPLPLPGGPSEPPRAPHIHALLTPGRASVSGAFIKCSSDPPDLRVSSAPLGDPVVAFSFTPLVTVQ